MIDFILPVSLFCEMVFIDAEIIVFARMIINVIDLPAIQIYASRLSETVFLFLQCKILHSFTDLKIDYALPSQQQWGLSLRMDRHSFFIQNCQDDIELKF